MSFIQLNVLIYIIAIVSGFTHSYIIEPFDKFNPQCSKGQSYWCQNLANSVSCTAFKHCVKAVWEKELPIEIDKSDVCQTCLEMVKEARDQLESNQTQEDIRTVLDASCKIIPIKIIKDDCIKLLDNFAVQLIDMLASQMNPSVVCSVAGLCNNAKYKKLEDAYHIERHHSSLNCNGCNSVMHLAEEKITQWNRNNLINILLNFCNKAGSYADGCSNIAINNADSFLLWLHDNFKGQTVCDFSGLCRTLQLQTERDVIVQKPDLPCDLCIQLVHHLKDILVANTTEEEFKQVLLGMCNLTKMYKEDCLNFVDSYYAEVYNYITNELDGNFICSEIGICTVQNDNQNHMHLLTPGIADKLQQNEAVDSEIAQLPAERLNPLTLLPDFLARGTSVEHKIWCSMCEYFLFSLQQELSLPSSEEDITNYVMKACLKLPNTIVEECDNFVQTYSHTFIALVIQEIDPSQVCPKLGVCSSQLQMVPYTDKPTCPLCLLAMQEINIKVSENNRTVGIITDIVDNLCIPQQFPTNVAMECVKFITDYKRSIVDMVVTEFTPQESCVYLELCVPPELETHNKHVYFAGNIDTNEILPIVNNEVSDSNVCVLCEFIISKMEQELKNKATEDEIRDAVVKICTYMPRTVETQCQTFINQYAELIINMLAEEVNPKEICTKLYLCKVINIDFIRESVRGCIFCEHLMNALQKVMTDPNLDEDINIQLERSCKYMPENYREYCQTTIDQFARQIEGALRIAPAGPEVCRRIGMCGGRSSSINNPDYKNNSCKDGFSYWCKSTATAASCDAIRYCQLNIWHADKPRKSHNKGRIVLNN